MGLRLRKREGHFNNSIFCFFPPPQIMSPIMCFSEKPAVAGYVGLDWQLRPLNKKSVVNVNKLKKKKSGILNKNEILMAI